MIPFGGAARDRLEQRGLTDAVRALQEKMVIFRSDTFAFFFTIGFFPFQTE